MPSDVSEYDFHAQAAGIDYATVRRKSFWNRRRIVERIKELQRDGKPLHVSLAEREYRGLVGAATMYFGSWQKAIRAAGLAMRPAAA